MTTLSVIVPAYNRAALLPATLDAILAQTVPPTEVIVVDDGSTDATPSVLARYGSAIRTFRIPNAGDLAARNAGLRAAIGDLVAFCDSDDLWHPAYLAAMLAMWQAEPDLRVAYANFVVVRDGAWLESRKFDDAPEGFWEGMRSLGPSMAAFDGPIVSLLLRFQPFFPSCMVADRRFLLGLGGWDASVGRIVGTDFATVLLMGEYAPFGVMQRPLVGIRKHDGNYSGDVQAMNLGDALILEHVLRHRPSLQPLAKAIQASIATRRAQALDIAFARRDFATVSAIAAMMPPGSLSSRQRLKTAIAALPGTLRTFAASGLLAIGSMTSAKTTRSQF